MRYFLSFIIIFFHFFLTDGYSFNPKTVGIIIIETGAEDGVWLETIKQVEILKSQGYNVNILTGKHFGKPYEGANIKINESISPREGISSEIYMRAIEDPYNKFLKRGLKVKKASLKEDSRMFLQIENAKNSIKKVINDWIKSEKIDVIISQNANAIPMHIPLGLAIKEIADQGDVASIFHNHDFPWEREKYMKTPYNSVSKGIMEAFPGKTKNTTHMVINDLNKRVLDEKIGQQAFKLPNVMNFSDVKYGSVDSYNKGIGADLGIPENSLILGQVTRVVERKNIEASIELLHKLNKLRGDTRVVLVITGEESIGDQTNYGATLKALIKRYGLENQVFWVSERVNPERGLTSDGKKIYSISDFYSLLNTRGMMTYPSTYEGFGNAFVEAIVAKVPILVNKYLVYEEEIGRYGFEVIEIEGGKITDDAVRRTDILLNQIDNGERSVKLMTQRNFNKGKKYLSYEVASSILKKAMQDAFEKRYKNISRIISTEDYAKKTSESLPPINFKDECLKIFSGSIK